MAVQLVQQYLMIKPQPRNPATVVQALAQRSNKKPPPAAAKKGPASPAGPAEIARQAQQFVANVAVGDWNSIKQALHDMPPTAGPVVYDHLLQLLNDPQTTPVLLPGEVLPLANAAPRSDPGGTDAAGQNLEKGDALQRPALRSGGHAQGGHTAARGRQCRTATGSRASAARGRA